MRLFGASSFPMLLFLFHESLKNPNHLYSTSDRNCHASELMKSVKFIFWSKHGEANKLLVFYARTPKTGGGTVRINVRALNRSLKYIQAPLRDRHISDEKQLKKYFRKNIMPLLKQQEKDQERKLLDSHMHFIDFTQYGYPNPIYLNTLRDPVQRFISRYGYHRERIAIADWDMVAALQRFEPQGYVRLKHDIPGWLNQSLEECIMMPLPECDIQDGWETDFSVPYFCGHDAFCNKYGSRKAMQLAKLHIEQWYPVVGILEMHKETYEVMEQEIPHFFKGLSRRASPRAKNKGILRQEISEEASAILKGRLREEYELYYFALQRLKYQYKNIKLHSQ